MPEKRPLRTILGPAAPNVERAAIEPLSAGRSGIGLVEDGHVYEVSVFETVVASHALRFSDGSQEPLHAHDWHVKVTLAGPRLDQQELLVDFVPLRQSLRTILAPLSNRDLGAAAELGGRNPSAEALATYIALALEPHVPAGVRLVEVEVEEEPGCLARYQPGR